jgi:hypothetical protein
MVMLRHIASENEPCQAMNVEHKYVKNDPSPVSMEPHTCSKIAIAATIFNK